MKTTITSLILLLTMAAYSQNYAPNAAVDFDKYLNKPIAQSLQFIEVLKPILGIKEFAIRGIDTVKIARFIYKLTYQDSINIRIDFVNEYRSPDIDFIHIYGKYDQLHQLYVKLFGNIKGTQEPVTTDRYVVIGNSCVAELSKVENVPELWGLYIKPR